MPNKQGESLKPLYLFICFIISFSAAALNQEHKEQMLQDFFSNPNTFYHQGVEKEKPLRRGHFSIEKMLLKHHFSTKSRPSYNDQVEDLLPRAIIEKNLLKIDQLGLTQGEVERKPWSDDYWPIYRGILGARYSDDDFYYLEGWKESFDYIKANPAKDIFKQETSHHLLSPSEKYDLLLGKKNFSLTKNMWEQGSRYYYSSPDGIVAAWMGICHGWAAASYMVKRPLHAIKVLSFDQKTEILFYPSDIKALASLLWASTSYPSHFISSRCRQTEPAENREGRTIQKECLDTNAATFHLSLVNGIGLMKKSFVMDSSYDYEVWNQPIVSYKYEYFNPRTKKVSMNLEDSLILSQNFESDPFSQYRAFETRYIVGVSVEVSYTVETSPTQNLYDSELMDEMNTVHYLYDLELDQEKNIIGGEWYHKMHPDFLWTPAYNTRAKTQMDYYLLSRDKWDGKKALPTDIKKMAQKMAKQGKPLAYIIESLIEISQKEMN